MPARKAGGAFYALKRMVTAAVSIGFSRHQPKPTLLRWSAVLLLQYVRRRGPPTIIFHGTADTTVPFKQAEDFCAAMKQQGNRCELMPYAGRAHGFFNYGRGDGKDFQTTLRALNEFLASLGYLQSAAAPK